MSAYSKHHRQYFIRKHITNSEHYKPFSKQHSIRFSLHWSTILNPMWERTETTGITNLETGAEKRWVPHYLIFIAFINILDTARTSSWPLISNDKPPLLSPSLVKTKTWDHIFSTTKQKLTNPKTKNKIRNKLKHGTIYFNLFKRSTEMHIQLGRSESGETGRAYPNQQ